MFIWKLIAVFASLHVHAAQLNCGGVVIDDLNPAVPLTKIPFQLAYSTAAGTLKVAGHPLRPEIDLVTSSGTLSHCLTKGDLRPLYLNLITDEKLQAALSNWNHWVASRPEACASQVESAAYLQPGATQVALVLRGLSSNPQGMEPMIQQLLDAGYNVVAPRLSKHFDLNILDLDKVDFTEWRRDAEETFASYWLGDWS